MNILVTGNLGYVGIPLTQHLAGAGHRVRGLDIDLYRRCQWLPANPVVEQRYRDVRDIEAEDLHGIETVIHLAGLSNDPLGDLNPDLTMQINAEASLRLAQLASDCGVRRLIAASSCSIYGAAGDRWINEDSTPNPVTAYARSKLIMEQGMASMASDQFEIVIVRPGTVYGASPRIRFDLVLNNLVAWAKATGKVHFKSDGQAWRPLLHVHDMISALSFLATAPSTQVAGQAFNIGFNDQNVRIQELGNIISSAIPRAHISQADQPIHDPRSYRVDCVKLAQIWQPLQRVNLAEGIAELSDLLDRYPVELDQFEGPAYQRVAHLTWLQNRQIVDASLRRRAIAA